MKRSNTVVVLQDRMVFIMLIILFVAFTVAGSWLFYVTLSSSMGHGSAFSVWFLRCISMIGVLVLPTLCVVDPYRYAVWYQFSSDGIYCCTTFRRKKLLPYSSFPYVMHGCYWHGAFWRDYIVFSTRFLTNQELTHINHVSPSTKLLKIQYSEKTCQKLLSILPQKRRVSVLSIKAAIERRKGS